MRCHPGCWTLFAVLVVFGGACGPTAEPPIEVQENVLVLDTESLELLDSVVDDGDQLVFSANSPMLDMITENTVIVCPVSDKTPYGLLRRVTSNRSNSDGTVTLETEQSTLEDVFWTGSASESIQVYRSDVTEFTPYYQGITTTADPALYPYGSWSPGPIEIDLFDVPLYEGLAVTGTIAVEPIFDFDLSISWGKVEKFSFENTSELTAKLALEGDVDLVSFSQSYTVASYQFGAVVIMAGPIPLIFTPTLDINVGVDGSVSAGLYADVTLATTVGAGVIFEDGDWSGYTVFPKSIYDIDVNWTPPTVTAAAAVQIYAGPNFSFLLYGVAGPYAYVYPYAELVAEILPDQTWALFAGVRGAIGFTAKLPVIGTLLDYSVPLFDKKWPLANGAF